MTTQTEIASPIAVESIPGYASRWRAMIFIAFSLLVISIDNTILNVALPSISRSLGASASELQWIIDSYVLVFASLLLTMGRSAIELDASAVSNLVCCCSVSVRWGARCQRPRPCSSSRAPLRVSLRR